MLSGKLGELETFSNTSGKVACIGQIFGKEKEMIDREFLVVGSNQLELHQDSRDYGACWQLVTRDWNEQLNLLIQRD